MSIGFVGDCECVYVGVCMWGVGECVCVWRFVGEWIGVGAVGVGVWVCGLWGNEGACICGWGKMWVCVDVWGWVSMGFVGELCVCVVCVVGTVEGEAG